MKEKSLTDLFIEIGLIEPPPDSFNLDEHAGGRCILDEKEKPQNEEKNLE